MNKFEEIIKIADIHVKRINSAIARIGHCFPIDESSVSAMQDEEIVWIEMLVNRFGKLQDLLGSKLIDVFLEKNEEDVQKLTMLDKINKLERLQIITSAELWSNMRKTRNGIAHEYPDDPEVMAKYLNQIFDLTPALLDILEQIKSRSSSC